MDVPLKVWAVVAVLGAGLFGAQLSRSESPALGGRAPSAEVPLPPKIRASVVPREALAATLLARPLFSPDRRAVATAEDGVALAEALPRLTAILHAPGLRQAIFMVGNNDHAVRAGEGDRMGGFRIATVGVDSVELDPVERGGAARRATLRLQADAAYRGAMATAAPVGSPRPPPAIDPVRRETEFETDQ